MPISFFICKMGPRITQCSAFEGFLSSFLLRSSSRPFYLIFFSLSKHFTQEITMKITGHRWKVSEMLKMRCLSQTAKEEEKEGRCRERNLNQITLKYTSGGFERMGTCALWDRVPQGNTWCIHVCILTQTCCLRRPGGRCSGENKEVVKLSSCSV